MLLLCPPPVPGAVAGTEKAKNARGALSGGGGQSAACRRWCLKFGRCLAPRRHQHLTVNANREPPGNSRAHSADTHASALHANVKIVMEPALTS